MPKYFPSEAARLNEMSYQADQKHIDRKHWWAIIDTLQHFKTLLQNFNYIKLGLSHGILMGIYYALTANLGLTITSSIANKNMADAHKHAGNMGLCMILCGCVGSFVAGVILDKTKAFKVSCRLNFTVLNKYRIQKISVIFYGFTLALFAIFVGSLHLEMLVLQYVVISMLGFFLLGFLNVGYDYAAEITWPVHESMPTACSNLIAMAMGVILTPVTTVVMEKSGTVIANIGTDDIYRFSIQAVNQILI